MLFLLHNPLTQVFIKKKNSEPAYETEYMQSLKQFIVQDVFLEYVLKYLLLHKNQCPMLLTAVH